jgi:ribonucleoside-diphosphate reductase alpha chain
MRIHPNLEETMRKQYYQPGEDVEDMLWRVARYVAGAERNYGWSEERVEKLAKEYYRTLSAGDWMCSSPFLMNAGTKTPMLSACFVLGLEDTMESIFDTLKEAALVHKFGGGTGFDFSNLRAEGASISTTGGYSSGPLSFLTIYDAESGAVKQGGRRRAANMGALLINHPDIEKFIDAKIDKTKFNNFNFSVIVPDWFMEAVEKDLYYALLDKQKRVVKTIKAAEIFDKIVKNNWESGEPGILFLDNINRDNPLRHLGDITVTNPCGEVPLLPYEACTIASLNLDNSVTNGVVNWKWIESTTRLVVRFLDSSIDVNEFPLGKIKAGVERTRKIGLGIMGLHGMLIQLGIPYNSNEALEMTEKVISTINTIALDESVNLCKEKGKPLGWHGSYYEERGIEVRNLTRLSIAPTGTISMIVNSSSSGCEPIFAVVYERTTRDKKYVWVNSMFEKIAKEEGFWSEELIQKIIDNNGRVTGIPEVPIKYQKLFVTAGEIDPEFHVRMQATLQKWVDNGISKTVNMPHNATIDDVKRVYMLAWKLGCKGITIYRDGSREGVLNTIKKAKKIQSSDKKPVVNTDPKGERPEMLLGVTMKIQSGCGKLWITINPYKGRPWEIFASSGSDGGCTSNIQEIARLTSLLFREGVAVEKVIDQLKSVKCAHAVASRCGVKSCSDAIAKQIERFMDLYKAEDWDRFLEEFTNGLQHEPNVEVEYEAPDFNFIEDMNKQMGCKDGKCG